MLRAGTLGATIVVLPLILVAGFAMTGALIAIAPLDVGFPPISL